MSNIAIITGASGGLGQACAARLEANGWRLALVSRNITSLHETSERIVIEGDVTTARGAQTALEHVIDRFSTAPTALINCVGNTLITPLQRTSTEHYQNCLRANLDSAFFTLQSFTGALIEAGQSGAAVLVSSVVAGMGVSNHAAIAAAKGGIESLVRAVAAEYAGHGIRINAIAPGLMRSPLTERLVSNERAQQQIAAQYPLGRFGSVDDGAAAICWLLSEQAEWITGQILPVDGGFSAIRPTFKA